MVARQIPTPQLFGDLEAMSHAKVPAEGLPAKPALETNNVVALDRSLAQHSNFGSALWWKAVAEAQQGKEEEARASIKQFRQSESGVQIDQPIPLVALSLPLRKRAAEASVIFRRLWNDTDSGP